MKVAPDNYAGRQLPPVIYRKNIIIYKCAARFTVRCYFLLEKIFKNEKSREKAEKKGENGRKCDLAIFAVNPKRFTKTAFSA